MEECRWVDYNKNIINLEDKDKVIVRRIDRGDNLYLCSYNKMFNCFDDCNGDKYWYEPDQIDKIFLIPKIN